jgi:RsmE family RNA methyltransferase
LNLILLDAAALSGDGTVRLSGRQAAHVLQVIRPEVGDRLQIGLVGGRMGTGQVLALQPGEVVLRASLDREPPPRSPVDLLVALPRPKILRKVLQAAASMGVARLLLLGSYRVEKSYFASPLLAPAALEEELRLGLEQGRDTIRPQVEVRRFFKPFVEDELEGFCGAAHRLLAHPTTSCGLASLVPSSERAVIAIGPEGGWTPYEAEQLAARGFAPFSLGPRALRVDVAVSFALGQAELWLRARQGAR